jgi:hypothetical protein
VAYKKISRSGKCRFPDDEREREREREREWNIKTEGYYQKN